MAFGAFDHTLQSLFTRQRIQAQSHRLIKNPEKLLRRFHATPHPRLIDECLSGTHALIIGLHNVTGLSWSATLPLTAILIRTILIAPISTYTHIIAGRRANLSPLINAWRHIYQDKIMKSHAAEGPKVCHQLLVKDLGRKAGELYQRDGAQRWKLMLPYLQFPIWLTVIETIRKMCGASNGLLSLLRKSLTWERQPDDTSSQSDLTFPAPPSSDPMPESELDPASYALPNFNTSNEVIESPLIPLESTFATEGALWFPDLLAPDPALVLPFILSGSLFANIYYLEMLSRKRGITPGRGQRRIRRILKILALAIGPATLSVPSAIHVYWISSAWCGFGWNIILDRYLPNKPIKPCRPWRANQKGPAMLGPQQPNKTPKA